MYDIILNFAEFFFDTYNIRRCFPHLILIPGYARSRASVDARLRAFSDYPVQQVTPADTAVPPYPTAGRLQFDAQPQQGDGAQCRAVADQV